MDKMFLICLGFICFCLIILTICTVVFIFLCFDMLRKIVIDYVKTKEKEMELLRTKYDFDNLTFGTMIAIKRDLKHYEKLDNRCYRLRKFFRIKEIGD